MVDSGGGGGLLLLLSREQRAKDEIVERRTVSYGVRCMRRQHYNSFPPEKCYYSDLRLLLIESKPNSIEYRVYGI